jgi:hypothetical protein
MPWPFGPDEDTPEVSEDAKPKRKTKKDKLAEQEELIQTLKFTPRTYTVYAVWLRWRDRFRKCGSNDLQLLSRKRNRHRRVCLG